MGNDEADDSPEEDPAGGQQQGGGTAGGSGGSEEEASFGGLTEAELAQILWDQVRPAVLLYTNAALTTLGTQSKQTPSPSSTQGVSPSAAGAVPGCPPAGRPRPPLFPAVHVPSLLPSSPYFLQLEQCLDATQPSIPAVSEPLRAIAEQVEHEMDNSTVSFTCGCSVA